MLKLAVLLLLACALFRWAFGFWPWQLAKGPDANAREVAAARWLLGVSKRADRTEVLAAHRLLITRVHPDRGGSADQVHKADEARDRLLAELGEPPAKSARVAGGEQDRADRSDSDLPRAEDDDANGRG